MRKETYQEFEKILKANSCSVLSSSISTSKKDFREDTKQSVMNKWLKMMVQDDGSTAIAIDAVSSEVVTLSRFDHLEGRNLWIL